MPQSSKHAAGSDSDASEIDSDLDIGIFVFCILDLLQLSASSCNYKLLSNWYSCYLIGW